MKSSILIQEKGHSIRGRLQRRGSSTLHPNLTIGRLDLIAGPTGGANINRK